MSYDFYIDKVCPHTIVDELGVLSDFDAALPSKISFPLSRPPSNFSVKINVDGVDIPPSGLYTKAVAIFNKVDPYRIISNVNDLILFRMNNEPVRTIQLPAGNAVSAKTLAKFLSRIIPDLNIEAENGKVVFSSQSPYNGILFSFPDPRWTDKVSALISTSRIMAAYKTLGLNPGKCGIGRKIFSGYSVKLNQYTFVEQYIVEFDDPVYNSKPVVFVTYQTIAPYCPRCLGSRVEYDYSIYNGSYNTVRNTDLLIQEFSKFLFTIKGTHWKWPWIGSNLSSRIGAKGNTGLGLASTFVQMDIENAFSVYQNIKKQQLLNFPGQNVTDAEYPISLMDTKVENKNDPTIFYANFTVMSKSTEPVQITRQLSEPDIYQITTSPGAVLQQAARGFQQVL